MTVMTSPLLVLVLDGGLVIESRTPNREVLGDLTVNSGGLRSWARHIKTFKYWYFPGSVGSIPL